MKKNLLLIFALMLMMFACKPERVMMTQAEIEAEKDAIEQTLIAYNEANSEKNFGKMVETLADEVTFFGTDSSEIITSFADYKVAIDRQWEEYESINYGEISDLTVFMDDNATLASVIYGQNSIVVKDGVERTYYLRIARTLVKKEEKWVIRSGIVGIVRTAQEAEEFYEPMEETESEE
jgi:hypothetical protein